MNLFNDKTNIIPNNNKTDKNLFIKNENSYILPSLIASKLNSTAFIAFSKSDIFKAVKIPVIKNKTIKNPKI